MNLKNALHQLTPPIVSYLVERLRSNQPTGAYGLSGDYHSWDEAMAASTGYDSDIILEKTRAALLKVKNGEAAYERDSVLFDDIQYSWPLLAGLMWVAAKSGGRLNVLDFGGSLGSSYFQNRAFIRQLPDIRWNIVEQPAHIRDGRRLFQNEHLRFYESIEECLSHTAPNVIVVSGVLQYLEHPYNLLATMLKLSSISVIIDRTPYWNGDYDRLSIQRVDPKIFDVSYPLWVFSLRKFREALRGAVFEEFESFENGLFGLMWKGFIIVGGQNDATRYECLF
jgi:putative methyltransferase (TIGR04325 family)